MVVGIMTGLVGMAGSLAAGGCSTGFSVLSQPKSRPRKPAFGGSAAAGLHQRGECEAQVAQPRLDFTRFDDPHLAGLFADARLRDALVPAFVTDFSRTTRLLTLADGSVVEVAFDQGEVVAGRRRDALCEIGRAHV